MDIAQSLLLVSPIAYEYLILDSYVFTYEYYIPAVGPFLPHGPRILKSIMLISTPWCYR